MTEGFSEIAAICTCLIGLIGVSATTSLPMWKVTVSSGENKTEMERRWEGLWMNCYSQANIRMQCKVYDSLLHLSPDLQAGRGLMCCSVALSGLGLLVALAGMKCTSCFQGSKWAKTIILIVAGAMQFIACICVFIPVSWTGHVIVRDLYDPLLTDTQKREIGGALYIGWVTGTFLFDSALLFTCRCFPSDNKPTMTSYHPVSTLKSTRNSHNSNILDVQHPISLHNVAPEMTNSEALVNQSTSYIQAGSVHISGLSLYVTPNSTPFNGLCDPVAYNCYY
ncbi:claudin-8-like [Poeciliopsis prolifica]|uniref:claudin-8-like n=1 Tax=Poeciliopsis prolifica TaxID=188132 RepID=UPI0024134560|nr:claudin-8-like [Poeciliopsis prolifica]